VSKGGVRGRARVGRKEGEGVVLSENETKRRVSSSRYFFKQWGEILQPSLFSSSLSLLQDTRVQFRLSDRLSVVTRSRFVFSFEGKKRASTRDSPTQQQTSSPSTGFSLLCDPRRLADLTGGLRRMIRRVGLEGGGGFEGEEVERREEKQKASYAFPFSSRS